VTSRAHASAVARGSSSRLRDQAAHVAAQLRGFLHQVRAHVEVRVVRHDERGLDLVVQVAVHVRHLQLVLEVGHGAQAPQDDARVLALAVVHQQAIERVDLDVGLARELLADHLHPLVHREERVLAGVPEDRDHQAIEDHETALDDREVPIRHGIERAGVDRGAHALGVSSSSAGGSADANEAT
jgi:hypothetical protein